MGGWEKRDAVYTKHTVGPPLQIERFFATFVTYA